MAAPAWEMWVSRLNPLLKTLTHTLLYQRDKRLPREYPSIKSNESDIAKVRLQLGQVTTRLRCRPGHVCYELSTTRASTWVEITKTCWNLRNRELSSEFLTMAVRDSWLSVVTQGADAIEGKKPIDCQVRGIENTKVIVNWRYLQDDLKFIYTTSVRLWKGIAKTNIWCDMMQYN